jgi:Tol biopolymer transport system component
MKNLIIVFTIVLVSIVKSVGQNSIPLIDKNLMNDINYPELFARGLVSTDLNDGRISFNQDGSTLIFCLTAPPYIVSLIFEMRYNGKEWGTPTLLPFSGEFKDGDPFISPCGEMIFFNSNRPSSEDSERKDLNIWVSKKENGNWGDPTLLSNNVNSKSFDYCPSVSLNGNLYFCSERDGGMGESDIYLSEFIAGEYQKAMRLPEPINSLGNEESPYISPDESFIIFKSYRNGDFGDGDLYISYKDSNGKWGEAINLGKEINSPKYESSPFMSFDKQFLFFVSTKSMKNFAINKFAGTYNEALDFLRWPYNGRSNVYWIKSNKIPALRYLHK